MRSTNQCDPPAHTYTRSQSTTYTVQQAKASKQHLVMIIMRVLSIQLSISATFYINMYTHVLYYLQVRVHAHIYLFRKPDALAVEPPCDVEPRCTRLRHAAWHTRNDVRQCGCSGTLTRACMRRASYGKSNIYKVQAGLCCTGTCRCVEPSYDIMYI